MTASLRWASILLSLTLSGVASAVVEGGPPLVVVHVKIAEVDRTALSELGFDWRATPFLASQRGMTDQPGLASLLDDDDTEVLTRPSVITNSGREATIELGGEPEGLRDVGLVLDVVPTTSGDRRFIELRTVLRVSSVPGPQGAAPTPQRRVENTARLDNGGTVVIGGQLDPPDDGLPWLGDLPVLGPLFRSRAEPGQRTLLILVTPWVTGTDGRGRSVGPRLPHRVKAPGYVPRTNVEIPNQQPNVPVRPHYPQGPGVSDRVQP